MKSVVFLGAGAAIPWGGQLSSDLTEMLIKDTTFMVKDTMSLAEYVCTQLNDFYGNKDWVNFETIIDAIETIFDFYWHKTRKGAGPNFISHFPLWLKESDITLDIFGTHYREFIRHYGADYKDESEEVFYFSNVIKRYNKVVCDSIGEYEINASDESSSFLNDALTEFYEYLQKSNHPIRTYTTNYDNLIPEIVCPRSKISFFDGFFDSDERHSGDGEKSPDVQKIIFDDVCNTYYNLHGSIYWTYNFGYQDFRYGFKLTPGFSHDPSEWTKGANTSIGKQPIVSNIITGYSKLDRIQLEPAFSFHQALNRDCQAQEKLLILVGYSFGDTHFNKIIRDSMSDGTVLLIITKRDNNYLHSSQGQYLINEILRIKGGFNRTPEITEEWIVSDNKTQFIYLKGFEEFLLNRKWLEFFAFMEPTNAKTCWLREFFRRIKLCISSHTLDTK